MPNATTEGRTLSGARNAIRQGEPKKTKEKLIPGDVQGDGLDKPSACTLNSPRTPIGQVIFALFAP